MKNLVDIPDDFNAEYYLFLYKDVRDKFNDNPKLHYQLYGYYENRCYKIMLPEDFNEETYLRLNPDIVEYYNKNPELKISPSIHYVTYGYSENRPYKLNLLSNVNLYEFFIGFTPGLNENNSNENNSNENNSNENKITNINNSSEKNQTSLPYPDNLIKIYNYKIDFKIINPNQVSLKNHKFLLIIDFPNIGGGVSAFLKIILSKYKENTNFLIARNYNGLVRFTINDEFYIEKEYDEIESIEFLESYKSCISKVFINHTKGHSEIFLNKIYELKKEVTMIMHDYYFLNRLHSQPYFEEIKNITKSEINIKNINKIIIANIANLDLIKPFLSINNEIVISPLPDFKNYLEYFPINNDKIIIGIIGLITNIKGSEIIDQLYEYIKEKNWNIEIIVFGKIFINNPVKIFPFENIGEFNNLLRLHKPNVLLETSLWPETYSYTLTLSILTQLPILSLSKPYQSVIQNRLSSYSKTYYYSNMDEIIDLVLKVKQDFFYTIDPMIYFNSYWDVYFLDNENHSFTKILEKSNIKLEILEKV